jgi:hypothetical protein
MAATERSPGRARRILTSLAQKMGKQLDDSLEYAQKPTKHFQRSKHLIAVVALSAVFFIISILASFVAAFVVRPSEQLIAGLSVIPPNAFIYPVLIAFGVFWLIAHLIALACAKFGKATLHAMEYCYLILGAFGLFGVAAVGIDEASYARNFYNDQVIRQRGMLKNWMPLVDYDFCSRAAQSIGPMPPEPFCQWLNDAKELAANPLDGNSQDSTRRVTALLERGRQLVSQASQVQDAEQKRKIDRFASFIEYDAKNSFDYLLQRGGWIAKIDKAIDDSQSSQSTFKYLGALILAFAIALRISKLSIEAFNLGPAKGETKVEGPPLEGPADAARPRG